MKMTVRNLTLQILSLAKDYNCSKRQQWNFIISLYQHKTLSNTKIKGRDNLYRPEGGGPQVLFTISILAGKKNAVTSNSLFCKWLKDRGV